MPELLFADDGLTLEKPTPCARPDCNGIYWVKSGSETPKGWTAPVWSLVRYTKEGLSGFKDSCLTTIISGHKWSYGENREPSFWGDEPFLSKYRGSVVVDFEGPVGPPDR